MALLVGLAQRGRRPDAILFADTGGEKPETYDFLPVMDEWCCRQKFPPIRRVQNAGKYPTLEGFCEDKAQLPSLAFGGRSCSQRWKKEPMHAALRAWPPTREWWDQGERVEKLIGIGADECHRARIEEDRWYVYEYPLISWGWGRAECVKEIAAAGLEVPSKSACFFCPAMKKHEVLSLAAERPDLFARAVAMERRAKEAGNLDTIKGLGRHWSWEALGKADAEQLKLFTDRMDDVSCVCANTPEE